MSKIRVFEKQARTIFTRTKIPGAKWVINQYVGCQHGCLYCYAKFMNRWRPANYGSWGSWVEIKANAPDLVKQHSVDGWVYMSSVSDAYQPLEGKYKLTRRVLEAMDKKTKLSILTKSALVVRDIDLFLQFREIEVGLTINGFPLEVQKIFEPLASTHQARLRALKKLKQAGLTTYTFISPIIPGLVDVRKIIQETKAYTDFYWLEMLNIRLAGPAFKHLLKKRFPQSWNTLKDKEKIKKLVITYRQIAEEENVILRGIEVH